MAIRYADFKIAEGELHLAVAKLLDVALLPPAVWTTFPAGWGRLPRATSGRLHASGLKAGFPDILVFHNARCIGIELKTPQGRVSKEQEDMHKRLANAGVTVHICYSTEEVHDVLKREELPLRKLGFAYMTKAQPTASIYEYKYLELQGVLGSGDIINPINELGVDGWRVMSFTFDAGVYRVLMERIG